MTDYALGALIAILAVYFQVLLAVLVIIEVVRLFMGRDNEGNTIPGRLVSWDKSPIVQWAKARGSGERKEVNEIIKEIKYLKDLNQELDEFITRLKGGLVGIRSVKPAMSLDDLKANFQRILRDLNAISFLENAELKDQGDRAALDKRLAFDKALESKLGAEFKQETNLLNMLRILANHLSTQALQDENLAVSTLKKMKTIVIMLIKLNEDKEGNLIREERAERNA